MRLFPKEQFLILKSEDFNNATQKIFKQILKFLNLPKWELKEYRRYHYAHYPKMDSTMRESLFDYFEPYNQRLYKYLGVNFNWKN